MNNWDQELFAGSAEGRKEERPPDRRSTPQVASSCLLHPPLLLKLPDPFPHYARLRLSYKLQSAEFFNDEVNFSWIAESQSEVGVARVSETI